MKKRLPLAMCQRINKEIRAMELSESRILLYERKMESVCIPVGAMQTWHFRDEYWLIEPERRDWPYYHQLVSLLATECLSTAFAWMNQSHGPESELVSYLSPYGLVGNSTGSGVEFHEPRSTSVGDVFVTSDGDVYQVAHRSFEKLGKLPGRSR